MKLRQLPCLLAAQILVLFPCWAGVFNDSIKEFSSGKHVVIKRDRGRGLHKSPNIHWALYSPAMKREIAKLNNFPVKKLSFDRDTYTFDIVGPVISVNGNLGKTGGCIIAAWPRQWTLGEHGVFPPERDISCDYAFSDPIGEFDSYVSRPDRHALVTKPLWFAEPKKDVAEYMTRLSIYKDAEEDERLNLMLEDFKHWKDIRGLAVLELLLEGKVKGVSVETLAEIINGKSKDFQFESARVVLKSKLGEKERIAMFDPTREGGWKFSVARLQQLTRLPILPDDPLMLETNKMLVRFKEQPEKEQPEN